MQKDTKLEPLGEAGLRTLIARIIDNTYDLKLYAYVPKHIEMSQATVKGLEEVHKDVLTNKAKSLGTSIVGLPVVYNDSLKLAEYRIVCYS